ncbi:HDOD domain-containing protein, partial [Mariprofundus ferrooxydans]|nr:HDOD domain-containing protein [Mariprofundus ferrooxydans]
VDAANFLIQSHGHKVLFDAADDIDPMNYAPIQRIGAGETHLAAVEIELEDAVKHMETALS